MYRRKMIAAALCSFLVGLLPAAQVPRKSPEFAIETAGKPLLLSKHRGEVVALMFILTYCPHCQQVTQTLTKLQQEYGPKGFQPLAVAIEDNAARSVPAFVKRFRPSFPVGWASRLAAVEYLQRAATDRLLMPQMVLVDRSGIIRAQFTGDDPIFSGNVDQNLRPRIEELLKPGAKAVSSSRP